MAAGWSRAVGKDGRTFVFAEAGEGPLVVLQHGFPDTPHGWEPIVAALAEAGYRALSPWLRGYHPDTVVAGRPYDMLTISSDPIALLDALGEREAILVGHDWGAAMIYGAATLHPDRVRAIVPIAIPLPALLPRNLPALWGARHFLALNMPWAEAATRRGDFAYLERLYRRWSPRWSGPARERSLAAAKRAFADRRSLLPAAIYERTAELLGPGSEALIVDGAGHWPHREDEERFLDRLLAFLGTVDRDAAAGRAGPRST